jgi:hypothetical protein
MVNGHLHNQTPPQQTPPQSDTSTTSEQPSVESPNSIPIPDEDSPVPSNSGSSSHLSNEQILSGMNYVDCGDDLELGYLTLSEAIDVAFRCHIEHAFVTSSHDNEPRTLAEALAWPEAEAAKWYQAALDEMDFLLENDVFELVKLPPGHKAIGSHWVFKVKRNADGSIERYKVQLVAKGYSQGPGFNFTETFLPTPKWATIQAVLAVAALRNLELWSADTPPAFLNRELNDIVFMQELEGFETSDHSWALCSHQSLYGLKQAGRKWHKKLHTVLVSIGFLHVQCEYSVWVYGCDSDDTHIIVPVFVNDMTIAAKGREAIQQVIEELKAHFKLRDLGETTYLLGVGVNRIGEEHSITLSQHQFTLNILECANMSDCNPASTPLDPHITLLTSDSPSTDEEKHKMRLIPYINILGAVAYLAIAM